MALWNLELFSITDALIMLNTPSTNQIAENKIDAREHVK